MNTTTSVLLGGTFVVFGQWAKGKSLGGKVIVATLFVAVFLSLLSQANAPLAQKFGLLFLVSAIFGNAMPVMTKLGIVGAK